MVPEPQPDDLELAELDRKREELSKQNPDIGPLIAETPADPEDSEASPLGSVFGSGSN